MQLIVRSIIDTCRLERLLLLSLSFGVPGVGHPVPEVIPYDCATTTTTHENTANEPIIASSSPGTPAGSYYGVGAGLSGLLIKVAVEGNSVRTDIGQLVTYQYIIG